MDHGGSVGGTGHNHQEQHELRQFFNDLREFEHGREGPLIRFIEEHERGFNTANDPSKPETGDPRSFDGKGRNNDPNFPGRDHTFRTADRFENDGFDKGRFSADSLAGGHGHQNRFDPIDSLGGAGKMEDRRGFSGPPTISATQGSAWSEKSSFERGYFIDRDGLHTVGSASFEHATTYFGYGVSVSASAGNTSLDGFNRDTKGFTDRAMGQASLHGEFAPSAVGSSWSRWDGKSDFGPTISSAFSQNTRHAPPVGATWKLNDGTKITFADYNWSHMNKNS